MRTGISGDLERESIVIDRLLEELAELRELDRRRHAHAPDSPSFARASQEVDALSEKLMDRARDLHRQRKSRPAN